MPSDALHKERHEKAYQAWLSTLTPEARQRHEEGAERAEKHQHVRVDIEHQFVGPIQERWPCALCGTAILHCLVEDVWRAMEPHEAPCGRICFMDPRASHFGGAIDRGLHPDKVHSGKRCAACRKPRLRIPRR